MMAATLTGVVSERRRVVATIFAPAGMTPRARLKYQGIPDMAFVGALVLFGSAGV